jgi:hypothetical protein
MTVILVDVISSSNSTSIKDVSFLQVNRQPDDPSSTSAATRCGARAATIRVFMYEMSPKFHFGLLGWAPPAGAGDV